jgi:hypothetical protein
MACNVLEVLISDDDVANWPDEKKLEPKDKEEFGCPCGTATSKFFMRIAPNTHYRVSPTNASDMG